MIIGEERALNISGMLLDLPILQIFFASYVNLMMKGKEAYGHLKKQ